MIDIHLANLALTWIGSAAGAAVLIAVAIIVTAAIRQHRTTVRRSGLGTSHATATSPSQESRREPALR